MLEHAYNKLFGVRLLKFEPPPATPSQLNQMVTSWIDTLPAVMVTETPLPLVHTSLSFLKGGVCHTLRQLGSPTGGSWLSDFTPGYIPLCRLLQVGSGVFCMTL